MHNDNILLYTASSEFINYTNGDKMGTSHNIGGKNQNPLLLKPVLNTVSDNVQNKPF